MIATLIVILYPGCQTYKGYQLGFVQRAINMTFGTIIFAAATLGQNNLGNWFYQQFSGNLVPTTGDVSLGLVGCRFLAFFVIWLIEKMILEVFKGWLPKRDRTNKGFSNLLDNVLGAVVSFIATYFSVYVALSMCQAPQNPWLIQQTVDSPVLRVIIYDTPGLSNGVFKTIFGISRAVG